VTRPAQRGSFRIIGGAWRRRRLDFVTDRDVRPSPDRVRETLFNWLAPVIEGARCLDLFAGSGALGLEALSRGASQVLFVDRERSVIERIRAHLGMLGAAARAELLQSDALQYLARTSTGAPAGAARTSGHRPSRLYRNRDAAARAAAGLGTAQVRPRGPRQPCAGTIRPQPA
jgi:16S rRNA (guanine(966)-N(2))-methyltransferase RsmD